MKLVWCLCTLVGCADILELDSYRSSGTAGPGGAAGSGVAGSAGAGPSAGGSGAAGGTGGSGGVSEPYAEEVLKDQPLGYWRLDDSDLPNAIDASSNGNNGLYSGNVALGVDGALASGVNRAVHFDGVSGHIDFGDRFDFPGTAEFSLEAWVLVSVVDAGYRGIFNKVWDPGTYEGYEVDVSADYGLRFGRWNQGTIHDVTTTAPPIGRFTHVVATYDSVTMRLYVNGAIAQSGNSDLPLTNIEASFEAGQFVVACFMGVLDELAVYDKALGNERVTAHYQAGLR
jgi:hypothetical protein